MHDRLTIVHFIRRVRAEDGGLVQAVLDMCQLMAVQGHRVILATLDATDVPRQWSDAGNTPEVVELEPAKWTGARVSTQGLRRFDDLLHEVDVAHLHTPWDPSNLQLSKCLVAKEIPYVVTVHGMLDDWSMRKKSLKKRVFLACGGRRLFQNATTVHFTAEAERDQALKWIPGADRAAIQSCAMDLSVYENLPGPEPALNQFPVIRPEREKILFLSRIHPKKGIELLLEAGAMMLDRQRPIQLLIAGPGDESYVRQLQAESRRLGIDEHTHFLGMVRGTEKLSLYQLADVFVLPTYQENFGLVLPEALACGTPVVTTRGTDIWRELEQAGATIVDNSATALTEAIEEFLNDGERRQQAGRQGKQYVNQWLDQNNVVAGYERMYRGMMDRMKPKN